MAFGAGEALFGRLVLELAAKTDQFVRDLGAAQTKMGGLAGFATRHATAFRATGMALTGMGAATLGMVGATVKAATDFETAFTGVIKTVDGVVDAEGNLTAEGEKLRQGILDLSTTIPLSSEELAGLAQTAGQLGVRGTENILKFVDVTAKMGVATNLTSEEAATAMARIANITQMPIENVERLGSTIVGLGNNMATTEAEIVEMDLRLSGAGATIGLTNAEVAGMAAAMTSLGIQAQMGGTAMSKSFVMIAAAVNEGGEDLTKFSEVAGMTADEFAKKFREDPAEAVVAFVEGLGRIKTSGGDLFGTLEDLGMSEVRLRDAMLRLAGGGDLLRNSVDLANQSWEENSALMTEAARAFGTTKAQMQILWNNVKVLAITLAEGLLPPLTQLLRDVVIPGVKWLADFAKEHQTVAKYAMMLAGAGGAVMFAFGPLLVALPTLVTLFGKLAPILAAKLVPAIGGVVSAVGGAGGLISIIGAVGVAGTLIGGLTLLGIAIYEGISAWQEWGKAARAEAQAVAAEEEYCAKVGIESMEKHTEAVLENTRTRIEMLHKEADSIKDSAEMNVETKNKELQRINVLIRAHYERVLASAKNKGQETVAIEQEAAEQLISLVEREQEDVAEATKEGTGEVLNIYADAKMERLKIDQGLAKETEAIRAKALDQELKDIYQQQGKILAELRSLWAEREELTKTEFKKLNGIKGKLSDQEYERLQEDRTKRIKLLKEQLAESQDKEAKYFGERRDMTDAKLGEMIGLVEDFGINKAHLESASQKEVLDIAVEERQKLKEILEKANKELLERFVHWANYALAQKTEIIKQFTGFGEEMTKAVEPAWINLLGITTNYMNQIGALVQNTINGMIEDLKRLKKELEDAAGGSWYTDAMKAFAAQSYYGFGHMAAAASGGVNRVVGSLRGLRGEMAWAPAIGVAEIPTVGRMASAPAMGAASEGPRGRAGPNVTLNVMIESVTGLDPREVGHQVGRAITNELSLELMR